MLTEFKQTDGILTAVPHSQNKKANSAVIWWQEWVQLLPYWLAPSEKGGPPAAKKRLTGLKNSLAVLRTDIIDWNTDT